MLLTKGKLKPLNCSLFTHPSEGLSSAILTAGSTPASTQLRESSLRQSWEGWLAALLFHLSLDHPP